MRKQTATKRRLTDDEVRAIAEKIAAEADGRAPENPKERLIAQQHELPPADEERVDDALVALYGLDPEISLRAEREADRMNERHGG
jgi:hypothetical protein